MSAWPAPPRWLVAFCGALVVVGLVVSVVGAIRIGVTVDETFHVVRLRNFLDRGWYLLDDDLGPSGPGSWVLDAYVYGPIATLLLHAANVALGNEGWSTVSTSEAAYAVRHLMIVLIGAVGVAATAGMARIVSGSWRWGVVAAGMLSALPMWWGHAMFNVKDIPVGTGCTLVTLGCMLAIAPRHGPGRGRALRLGSAAAVFAGVALSIGTRPGMWVVVGAGVAWSVVVLVVGPPRDRGRGRAATAVVLSAAAPLGLLAIIYPHVFARPDEWLLGSASGSSSNGMVSSRAQLPFAIATTVPIVLLVIGLLGSYGRATSWLRGSRRLAGMAPCTVLLLVQALLLPVLLVAVSAPVSGGLRHVLFAAPAVAVLVASGLAQLMGDSGHRGTRVLPAVAVLGMTLPVVAQVQLFPYSYGYANELTSVAGVRTYPDFWQASFREYADQVGDDFVVCGASTDPEGRPVRRMPNGGQSWLDLGEPCTSQALGVLTPFAGDRSQPGQVTGQFVALRVRFEPPSQGCRELASVTRTSLWRTLVLSTAEVCPLVLPQYDGRVDLDARGRGSEVLLGGWSGTGGDTAITVTERASLGFAMPDVVADADDDLRVVVTGEATNGATFLLNNEPARAVETDLGWTVTPASALPAVGDSHNLVVTVVVEAGQARLSAVEVGRWRS